MGLSSQAFTDHREALHRQFATLTYPGLEFLLSYQPLRDRNEFDPSPCGAHLLQANPQLKTAWPKITGDDGSMQAVLADDGATLIPNRFNIPEPAEGEIVPPEQIDIVFVPLLAFDRMGYRVGYGKGYYDRFLARCRPGVLRVGFSFFEPEEAIPGLSQFDVPLSVCITPKRIYEF